MGMLDLRLHVQSRHVLGEGEDDLLLGQLELAGLALPPELDSADDPRVVCRQPHLPGRIVPKTTDYKNPHPEEAKHLPQFLLPFQPISDNAEKVIVDWVSAAAWKKLRPQFSSRIAQVELSRDKSRPYVYMWAPKT